MTNYYSTSNLTDRDNLKTSVSKETLCTSCYPVFSFFNNGCIYTLLHYFPSLSLTLSSDCCALSHLVVQHQ